MSAVLRAVGSDFDVDAFLENCTLRELGASRRGEPVFPESQPDGRRHELSGVELLASEADFDQLPRQMSEAEQFLRLHEAEIRRLCAFPGVEKVFLDFGIARREVAVQRDFLSPELIRIAGFLGIGVALSHYPIAAGTISEARSADSSVSE